MRANNIDFSNHLIFRYKIRFFDGTETNFHCLAKHKDSADLKACKYAVQLAEKAKCLGAYPVYQSFEPAGISKPFDRNISGPSLLDRLKFKYNSQLKLFPI